MAIKYNQKFMRSDIGIALYNKWNYALRCGVCDEWEDFNAFCVWALTNEYEYGKTLVRTDKLKPYGPENCHWAEDNADNKGFAKTEWIKKWNETVNRFRVANGMEPFEV